MSNIETNKLSRRIHEAVCLNLGIDPDRENSHLIVNDLSPNEILERWLTWNGILGFHEEIIDTIKDICIAKDGSFETVFLKNE